MLSINQPSLSLAHCRHSRVRLEPCVYAMAARQGPPSIASSALYRVDNATSCITFTDQLQTHCTTNGFPWWFDGALGTNEEKAAAAKAIHKAHLLGLKIEAEIDEWLEPAPLDVRPVQLDMSGAASLTPMPPTPASATPTSKSKMPSAVSTMYTLKQIELMVVSTVAAVTSSSFIRDLKGDRTGTLALQAGQDLRAAHAGRRRSRHPKLQ